MKLSFSRTSLTDFVSFSRHLIIDMDRICRIWEIELQTVIEIHKIGHRKRMLHSVGLPICKKKEEKKNQIHVQDSNGSEVTNKKDEQNSHTNGHKMNHGKNRSAKWLTIAASNSN